MSNIESCVLEKLNYDGQGNLTPFETSVITQIGEFGTIILNLKPSNPSEIKIYPNAKNGLYNTNIQEYRYVEGNPLVGQFTYDANASALVFNNVEVGNHIMANINAIGWTYMADVNIATKYDCSNQVTETLDEVLKKNIIADNLKDGTTNVIMTKSERDKLSNIDITKTITVTVPDMYSNIQDVLDDLSVKTRRQGVKVIVRIMSGYRIQKGFYVENGDYSHFVIQSEDEKVQVSDSFTGTLMTAINANMPQLEVLFDQRNKGTTGYYLENGSHGYIKTGCGVINAGAKGDFDNKALYVGRNCRLSADGCIFTNAGGRGAWITRCANASMEYSNFDNAGDVGIYVSRNSTVHMPYSSVQNAGNHAIWVHRNSRFNAQDGINISGAKGNGIFATRCSSVSVNDGCVALNIGAKGVECINATVLCNSITLTSKTVNGCDGIISNGGNVYADDCDVSGFEQGLIANRGGIITAERCYVHDNNKYGISVDKHGKIYASNSIVINNGIKDVVLYAGAGGDVNIYNTRTTDTIITKESISIKEENDANKETKVVYPNISNTNVNSFNVVMTNRGVIWA